MYIYTRLCPWHWEAPVPTFLQGREDVIRRDRQAPFSTHQGPVLGVGRAKEEISRVHRERRFRLGGGLESTVRGPVLV